jgi:hypothetical protein
MRYEELDAYIGTYMIKSITICRQFIPEALKWSLSKNMSRMSPISDPIILMKNGQIALPELT